MKQALISLLVITGMFTSLNGGALTKGVQNAKAIPAKAPAKTRVDQGQPKVGTLKPADFGKFRDSAKGKVLVLNFWATWCIPCREEMPRLVAAHHEVGDRVQFLGIDIQDSRMEARAFMDEFGMTFPSVFDGPDAIKT